MHFSCSLHPCSAKIAQNRLFRIGFLHDHTKIIPILLDFVYGFNKVWPEFYLNQPKACRARSLKKNTTTATTIYNKQISEPHIKGKSEARLCALCVCLYCLGWGIWFSKPFHCYGWTWLNSTWCCSYQLSERIANYGFLW